MVKEKTEAQKRKEMVIELLRKTNPDMLVQYISSIHQRLEYQKKFRYDYIRRPEVKQRMKVQRKKYYSNPIILQKRKDYMKEYSMRPNIIKKKKEYFSRPDVKERLRIYNSRPEVKEHQKEYRKIYQKLPEVRAKINARLKLRYNTDIEYRERRQKAVRRCYNERKNKNSIEKKGNGD